MDNEPGFGLEQQRQEVRNLQTKLEEETAFWSGGYSRHASYQNLLGLGVVALPQLLEGIASERAAWASMQIVWVTARDIGSPIEFSEEVRGKYDLVRERVLSWGLAQGFVELPN